MSSAPSSAFPVQCLARAPVGISSLLHTEIRNYTIRPGAVAFFEGVGLQPPDRSPERPQAFPFGWGRVFFFQFFRKKKKKKKITNKKKKKKKKQKKNK
jgi:hypothetical protein